jgi:hypothetical protein
MEQKMTKSKNTNFSQSFIKKLIIIAVVTVVTMASSKYLVHKMYNSHTKTPIYTSQQSYISSAP